MYGINQELQKKIGGAFSIFPHRHGGRKRLMSRSHIQAMLVRIVDGVFHIVDPLTVSVFRGPVLIQGGPVRPGQAILQNGLTHC